MAKKKLKKKVQSKADVSKLAAPVLESARDIWLAGLGAFSVAQQESGRMLDQGSKLFEKLVAEGSKLENQSRSAAQDAVGGIKDNVESRVDSVKQQAADNWDKLERVFEDRVARVLGRLGVPTADDVNKLSARVQKLSSEVSRLAKQKPAATSKKKVTKKASSKS